MNKNRCIYVVGPSIDYADWMQGKLVSSMEDADLVVFTGGEDVSPNLYGDSKHPTTSCNPNRDGYETGIYHQALQLKKPMIGICRGSQFLCVMNGGKLVQHQQNSPYLHLIKTFDDKLLEITSEHHQAAYPWNLKHGEDFKTLAWTNGFSKFHFDGKGNELLYAKEKCEVETIYYPKTKCLGIQGHPEWMNEGHPTVVYLQNLLDKFMENEL